MSRRISFEEELDKLQKSGFSEEQVKAIWDLVTHVAVTVADKEIVYEWVN